MGWSRNYSSGALQLPPISRLKARLGTPVRRSSEFHSPDAPQPPKRLTKPEWLS